MSLRQCSSKFSHRSPVGCNFISGRSESVHEESADDEGRTVPSSGAALFLRFALNLWRYPARPSCEDLFATHWLWFQRVTPLPKRKQTSVDRELASSSSLPSPSNLFVEDECVFHVVPETHHTIFIVLLRDTMSSFEFQCPWPAKQKYSWLP